MWTGEEFPQSLWFLGGCPSLESALVWRLAALPFRSRQAVSLRNRRNWADERMTPRDAVPTETSSTSPLIIADPCRAVGDMLAAALWMCAPHETITVCTSGKELADALATTSPSLLLSELSFPDAMLLDVLQENRKQMGPIGVIAWTSRWSELWAGRFRGPWFLGVLSKCSPLSEVVREFQEFVTGKCAKVGQLTPCRRLDSHQEYDANKLKLTHAFTQLQLDLLLRLAKGGSVKEVATALKMTPKAVDSHKYRIMKHLEIHDRVELSRWAIRSGLIEA